MTTSRTIAGLLGPTLVALAAATVLNLGSAVGAFLCFKAYERE